MAEIYTVICPFADLLDHPGNGPKIGRRDSQLLFGESFKGERTDGDYIFGVSQSDGYQGYIHKDNLKLQKIEPTHIVSATMTHIYEQPDFRTRPVMGLSFLSRLSVDKKIQDGFVSVPEYGWVFQDHIAPIDSTEPDYTQTTLRFLGTPYLYGGRSAFGIDCSGLVQLALLRAGIPCPRDSGQQIAIGREIDSGTLQRGDLVFFKGHVGIMIDAETLLNATARSMDVCCEKLSVVEKHYGGILAARRI